MKVNSVWNKAGLDWGYDKTNIDISNGIRYGVISQNSISGDALNDLEPIYPESGEDYEDDGFDCVEAIGFEYDKEGYKLINCLDSDIMILKSPYYTYANFCSPCVPGAGNLNDLNSNGVKTYCLAPDWFEQGIAPYPVYSVETDKQVGFTTQHLETYFSSKP